jgi:DnaJ-class molecular chaperone
LKKDFYKILGVNREAGPARIKKAYRKAAKRYHPDISPKGADKFKEVQEAYETLSDPQKKGLYDQQFLQKPPFEPQIYSFHEPTVIRTHLFDEIDQIFGFDDLSEFFTEPEENSPHLSVEITLTPEEARGGCEIPLKVPFRSNCRRCHGTGRIRNLICGLCRGLGEEELEKEIRITIPSGLKERMKMRFSIGETYLFVTLRVSQY